LIPQGTVRHFLSSLIVPRLCLSAPGYGRPSWRFLRSASCSSMLTMRRSRDRNVVARNRSNIVCNSTNPWTAARSNVASVPITCNPRCRAIVTPSLSSINKMAAWSSDASDMASRSPSSRCARAESTGCFRFTTSTTRETAKSTHAQSPGCLHGPVRPSQREGSKPF
jgi:hypothetical protein